MHYESHKDSRHFNFMAVVQVETVQVSFQSKEYTSFGTDHMSTNSVILLTH